MVCGACGLHYRNPRPTQAAILELYNAGHTFSQWQKELPVREFLWKKRLDILLRHRHEGRLLDVGTGDGFFLKQVGEHFEATGTEISSAGVSFAEKHGVQVLHGTFRMLEAKQQFDVITLWHVLEHLPFPGIALKDLRRYLQPDGLLVIAVPNETLKILNYRKATQSDSAQKPFNRLGFGKEIHLTFFTPKTLKHILEATGYSLLEFGVDDVELDRTQEKLEAMTFHEGMNELTGAHLSKAMYVVCRKAADPEVA